MTKDELIQKIVDALGEEYRETATTFADSIESVTADALADFFSGTLKLGRQIVPEDVIVLMTPEDQVELMKRSNEAYRAKRTERKTRLLAIENIASQFVKAAIWAGLAKL